MNAKADYVRSQSQTRDHTCHWPGCTKQCPPAMWGCREHWYMLPKTLRDRIWGTYRPGQEKTRDPSREYIAASRDAQGWIAANHGTVADPGQSALDFGADAGVERILQRQTGAAALQHQMAIDANIADGFMEVTGLDDKGARIVRVTDKGHQFLADCARLKVRTQ